MRKKIIIMLLYCVSSSAQNTLTIFDNVLFYDGYATTVNMPTPTNVIRLRNDLFTRKLTSSEIESIGTTLTINVSIAAACDNYDRIGNVNLALVPKGAINYDTNVVQKIEIGRYITPFMDMNVPPNLVPYTYTVDHISKILKDSNLNTLYDFWVELELFGVPYAANSQIQGCAGRSDVFYGTLEFITNTNNTLNNNTFLLPLNFKNNLNNYQAGASDAIGQTVRTINFNLPSAINNAKFYLISSNHGANSGGEEYIRRWHYVYLDNTQILSYKPGETSCEQYRIYNTQPNGIYGLTPRTDAQWQSFSNWCPGAKIPIRTIDLGNLSAGNHSFKIAVPTAVFAGQQGNFPISVYLQGENTVLQNNEYNVHNYTIYPIPATEKVYIETGKEVHTIQIIDLQGRTIQTKEIKNSFGEIDLTTYQKGIYFLQWRQNNILYTEKIIKE